MSLFAQYILVLPSLVPLALMYAWTPSVFLAASMGVLWVIPAAMVLRRADRGIQTTPLTLTAIKPAHGHTALVLLTYVVPLVLPEADRLTFGALFIMMAAAVSEGNFARVNPLFGLAGYRFYNIVSASNRGYLLIAKGPMSADPDQEIQARRLSPYVWLAAPRPLA